MGKGKCVGKMKNSNIVSVDAKGRILIPKHIRKSLYLDIGTDIIIIPDNEKTQAKMLPLARDKTAELRFTIADMPGSLAHVADVLSHFGMNIILSESRTIQKNRLAEWDVIVDLAECNGRLEKAMEKIGELKEVKKFEVVRK